MSESDIKNEALELAATICDEYIDWAATWGEHKNWVAAQTTAEECASAIRGLKSSNDVERHEFSRLGNTFLCWKCGEQDNHKNHSTD